MLKNLAPAAISAVVMGIVGYVIRDIVPGMLWQLGCVIICVVVYFITLLTLFPKVRTDLMNVSFVKKVLHNTVKKEDVNE